MKKIIFYFCLAVLASPLFTSCDNGGDDTPPPPPVDTTGVDTTKKVDVEFNFQGPVDLSTSKQEGFYKTVSEETIIRLEGVNLNKTEGFIVELIFPTNKVGTYTHEEGAEINIDLLPLNNPSLTKEYTSADEQASATINITEYNSVGGEIKGTFSGRVLTDGGFGVDLKDGVFTAKRTVDVNQ